MRTTYPFYLYLLHDCYNLLLFCFLFVSRFDYYYYLCNTNDNLNAMDKIKEPVRLRTKQLTNGNKSLFLDIYIDGRRSYDYLRLYLIPEKSAKDKAQNKQTLALANAIKAQRIVDIQNGRHGFADASKKNRLSFIDYLWTEEERYKQKGSKMYAQSVRNSILHLIRYGGDVKFKQVDKQYLIGYIKYLDTAMARGGKPLSQASKSLYFAVLVTALNRAVKEEIIDKNPAHLISAEDRPRDRSPKREFLTFDEVNLLISSAYDFCNGQHKDIRQSFLFSCFCGLRLSDCRALTWGDIITIGGEQVLVRVRQQKTGELIDIPLSANAIAQLPKRGHKGERIFNLPMAWVIERELDRWVKSVGIEKHITYHCSRHTHATLLLTYGADIYTVSKLLGHTRVQTTEIYAKIIDDKKRQAVDLIPTI